jgi:hypothetical protein
LTTFSRLEQAVLGRSDLDVTERRRRIFLALAVAVTVPFTIFMDLTSLPLLSTFEIVIDSLAVVLLIGTAFLIRYLASGTWFYRIDALFFGALLLYYLTEDKGYGTAAMWAFAYPLVFLLLLGNREGVIWTGAFFAGAACILLLSPTAFPPHFRAGFLATFFMVAVMAYAIESLRGRFERESHALIGQLETALSEVKTLKGLLPICAHCKKIRDDTGYWNQIESYLQEHADASFTHSVCPDCIQELYPEFADRLKRSSEKRGGGKNGQT